jgi:hypothetical protein
VLADLGSMPRLASRQTAPARVAQPSLRMLLRTCISTVRGLMSRIRPISLLVRSLATSHMTSSSRGVSLGASGMLTRCLMPRTWR